MTPCGRCKNRVTTRSLKSEVESVWEICNDCALGQRISSQASDYHVEDFHKGRPVPTEFLETRARMQLTFVRQCLGRTPESVHDFGSGNGIFLDHCRSKGILTFFSEMDRILTQKLRERNHLEWENSVLLAHHHLSHSLEHLSNPRQMLAQLRDTEATSLYVEVPNEFHQVTRHTRKRIGDGHLWLFSKKSLTELVTGAGWKILHVEALTKEYEPCHETESRATWIRLLAI